MKDTRRTSRSRRLGTRLAVAALPAALGLGLAASPAQAYHVHRDYFDDGYHRKYVPAEKATPTYGTTPYFDLYRVVDEYLDHRYGEDDLYHHDDYGHDDGDTVVVVIDDSEIDL